MEHGSRERGSLGADVARDAAARGRRLRLRRITELQQWAQGLLRPDKIRLHPATRIEDVEDAHDGQMLPVLAMRRVIHRFPLSSAEPWDVDQRGESVAVAIVLGWADMNAQISSRSRNDDGVAFD